MILVEPDFVLVSDTVQQTPYMTAEDINIGWGAILETFEMRSVGFDFLNSSLIPSSIQYLCLYSYQGV